MAQALEGFLVESRVVVPRSGVAGLLKRVLRERIDERRAAIKAAVLALDGSNAQTGLVPARSAAAELFDDSKSSASGVAHSVTGSSDFGAARLSPSDPTAAPQTLQAPRPAPEGRASHRRALWALSAAFLLFGGLLVWKMGHAGEHRAQAMATAGGEEREILASRAGSAEADETEMVDPDDLENQGANSISLDSLPPVEEAAATQAGSTTGQTGAAPRPRKQAGTSKSTTSPKEPPKAESEPDPLERIKRQAAIALGGAASQVGLCRRPGGQAGKGQVQVTFAPSGQVTAANLNGPFAGTPVGRCVLQKFKRATISPFSGAPVTLLKSFSISE
jgi:hypothetical protein